MKPFTTMYLIDMLQVIHIAIVAAGHNASREVASQLIKSILFYRQNPLHFHFISDSAGSVILGNLFRTWKLPGGVYCCCCCCC